MIRVSAGRTLVLIAALSVTPAFGSRTHHAPTAGHAHSSLAHRARKAFASRLARVSKPVGQRGIAPERATEIQSALIRENYMSGTPTGQWDTETEMAMQKFQSDHGWQTKLTPDSRALIKLGLGPNASTGTPAPVPSNSFMHSGATPVPESGTLATIHSIAN